MAIKMFALASWTANDWNTRQDAWRDADVACKRTVARMERSEIRDSVRVPW
jgi:hypothetical protein